MKKITRRNFLLAAGVAASAAALAGCGAASSAAASSTAASSAAASSSAASAAPVTLNIYAQYADDDTKVPYDYAVKELAAAYPNVTLNLIVQAQDDGTTLKTLAATGKLPDIFQANTDIISTLRETNQVMVLNDVAKSSGYLDKLYDSDKDLAYADDGNIYAFPYAGQEYVLWYYNKAVFADAGVEVPQTYDDLKKCIAAFQAKSVTPMALFGKEGWITTAMYDVVATRYTAGGIRALDEKKANIADEAYVSAAKTLEDLTKTGMFQTDVTTTNYDQASELFLSGKSAMFLNGQWYIEDATKALGDNVDWMYYPAQDADSYTKGRTAFSGGGSTSGYAVNPDGENAQLAAEVAEFITEKYCEAKVMYRHNPLVALNTGAKSEDALPAMMQKLSDAIPTISSTTKFTWGLTNAVFNDGIQTETQGLVSGQYSADEFIADMTDVMSQM